MSPRLPRKNDEHVSDSKTVWDNVQCWAHCITQAHIHKHPFAVVWHTYERTGSLQWWEVTGRAPKWLIHLFIVHQTHNTHTGIDHGSLNYPFSLASIFSVRKDCYAFRRADIWHIFPTYYFKSLTLKRIYQVNGYMGCAGFSVSDKCMFCLFKKNDCVTIRYIYLTCLTQLLTLFGQPCLLQPIKIQIS